MTYEIKAAITKEMLISGQHQSLTRYKIPSQLCMYKANLKHLKDIFNGVPLNPIVVFCLFLKNVLKKMLIHLLPTFLFVLIS